MRGFALSVPARRRYGGFMNSSTATTPPATPTRRHRGRPLTLPNILTYGRIVAVPLVVGCMFWQNILHGGLWLRWVALGIFIAACALRIRRARARRQAIAELRGLDDRTLRDIGLSASDIEYIVWRDMGRE